MRCSAVFFIGQLSGSVLALSVKIKGAKEETLAFLTYSFLPFSAIFLSVSMIKNLKRNTTSIRSWYSRW